MAETITLLSWNVNGARAVHKKGFVDWLTRSRPDILCLQETRAEEKELPDDMAQPTGYRGFWNSSIRKRGYSGTALLTRLEPLSVQLGLGIDEFDQEGRALDTIVVPNARARRPRPGEVDPLRAGLFDLRNPSRLNFFGHTVQIRRDQALQDTSLLV